MGERNEEQTTYYHIRWKIRADLERKRTPIGSLNMRIAGHAKAEGLTVVTNNTREFCRVEGLVVEDWTKE